MRELIRLDKRPLLSILFPRNRPLITTLAMHLTNKPPKRKRETPERPGNPKDVRPEAREQPAAAERTEDVQPESEKETRATPDASATSRRPVTNQDEQDKITNAGENDVLVNDK